MYLLSTPAEPLKPYIENYWHVVTPPGDSFRLSVDVFVDARADLILNFGSHYTREVLRGRVRRIQHSTFEAQRLKPMRISQEGDVFVAGVRFRTAGVMPFVSQSLHIWTNRAVPATHVFGQTIASLEKKVCDAKHDIASKTNALNAFFLNRFSLDDAKRTLIFLKNRMEAKSDEFRVAELARISGMSLRGVDRLFRRHLGMGPKTFARITRFQRALNRLKTDPGCTLATVAAECGYYDQPHFVREFKLFSGTVPKRQVAYFPREGPSDFSPNVVRFLQDGVGK